MILIIPSRHYDGAEGPPKVGLTMVWDSECCPDTIAKQISPVLSPNSG